MKAENFSDLSQNSFDFSHAAGEFLIQVIVATIKKHIPLQRNLAPSGLITQFLITHNDFHSSRIYAEVAKLSRLVASEDAIALLYILGQVNVAHILLPQVLSQKSNLLFRLRFLMAYHVINALGKLPTHPDSGIAKSLEAIQSLPTLSNERKIRNILAHYGFGEGRRFLVSDDLPLDQMIEGFSGENRSFVESLVSQRLTIISEWIQANLSKESLKPFRARLGDHT